MRIKIVSSFFHKNVIKLSVPVKIFARINWKFFEESNDYKVSQNLIVVFQMIFDLFAQ